MFRRKNCRSEFSDHCRTGTFFHAVQLRRPFAADHGDLCGLVSAVGVKIQRNFRVFTALPHQFRIFRPAEGTFARKKPHSLEKICFSLRVGAVDHVAARFRENLAGTQVAEIAPRKAQRRSRARDLVGLSAEIRPVSRPHFFAAHKARFAVDLRPARSEWPASPARRLQKRRRVSESCRAG